MTEASKTNQQNVAWYSLTPTQVAEKLKVDPQAGLSSAEVKTRIGTYGPNQMVAETKESGFQAILRQYQDLMQLVLLGAGVINQLVTHDLGTTVVLIGLTIVNAVMGIRQEAKAEASLAALQGMMKTIARVRRDGQPVEIDATGIVPGDIVLMEAGNLVPADGRLFVAATVEIEEGALTGESVPVSKDIATIDKKDVPLGDRACMAYMNTSVTRGRGEMIVTGTGMDTEIGHIGAMLNSTKSEKTPLQKKLDELTKILAAIASFALVVIVVVGAIRGQSLNELFITGIALAVAAIPTGLPAVVTTLLSLGTRSLADQNAIMKRLPAVETLGSTSAICSDKTGTLTLNKMTARELVIPGAGNRFKITGEGYSTQGQILRPGGADHDLDPYLLPMALCADATLDGDQLIGDPTEGALIVLAAKGGFDLDETRTAYPRIAEVPFDAEYKFMATFHNMKDDTGKPVVRCFVKGAPDVLIGRGADFLGANGERLAINDEYSGRALSENERLASGGQRVMVVARRDFDPATFDANGNLIELVKDLTLLGMVGIVDPPRAEAKLAISECKSAGIRVRMITGDHAVTAAAIGEELGITGEAITGAEFAAMSDDELLRRIPDIGVIARVAPEDKLRLVTLLQQSHEVVAMTGDGVNDAPALKKADIGVAMGITGTEVSKGAAVMILTDDNFATIVKAVEFGRSLYDNLMKYLRFQMSSLVAFIAIFLGATIFNIANGTPLNPLQILWLNFAIDIPLAIALGFDIPTPGLMKRKPRSIDAPVFTSREWARLVLQGMIMTVTSLGVYAAIDDKGPVVATTMLLTTLALSHCVVALCVRDERATIFSREAIPGGRQLRMIGISVLLTLLVTEIDFLQRIFGTEHLSLKKWILCVVLALAVLVEEEVFKFILSRRNEAPTATSRVPQVAAGSTARAA
jgi:Ca2+-transporting ATPase